MKFGQRYERFGIHLMLDGYGAPKEILKDRQALTRLLIDVPIEMGMHAISDPVVVEVGEMNRKDPGGISGFVLIAESHFSFHTFPKRGFVTLDIYTCQNDLDTEKLTRLLSEALRLKESDVYIQNRGIRYPSENIH
jgi:S-adenosylmethionine decarboxylase